MKDSQYINIQGWMGKHLGLRANDLICFAVIYGFSMDGESQFKGNLKYLSACMFASQPTVLLALNKLLECNLILKQDDVVKGKKRCYYSTNVIYDEGNYTVMDSTKEPLVMTTKEPLVVTAKESLAKEYNNKEYKGNNKEKKSFNKDKKNQEVKEESFLEPAEDERAIKFYAWVNENYPRIMSLDKPLTYDEFKKLRDKFGEELLLDKMDNLENRRTIKKDYVSAYLSLNNWCKQNGVKPAV